MWLETRSDPFVLALIAPYTLLQRNGNTSLYYSVFIELMNTCYDH